MGAKVNYTDLKKLQERLNKLNKEQIRQFNEAALKELAAKLLGKVVKRTPVGVKPDGMNETKKVKGTRGKSRKFLKPRAVKLQTLWAGYSGGALRRGWTVGEVKRNGDEYTIEVYNSEQYASYVEFGHRGVFIPELKKTLHVDTKFTAGKYMLTISEDELKRDAPGILEKKLNAFIKGVFDGNGK